MNWLKNIFKHKHSWETITQLGVHDEARGYVSGNFYSYEITYCRGCKSYGQVLDNGQKEQKK